MSKPNVSILTFMRRESANLIGLEAGILYCSLEAGQPLLLIREPGNPADRNAVRVADLIGSPCGYLARESAPLVAYLIDSGVLLLARTFGPCLCSHRMVRIWSEDDGAGLTREVTEILEDKVRDGLVEKMPDQVPEDA